MSAIAIQKETSFSVRDAAIGIGIIVGLGFLGRHIVSSIKEDNAQKRNTTEGDPSAFATQLYMSMGNQHWYSGSKSLEVFKIIRLIPTKSVYSQVQTMYKDNYHTNLNQDLQQRLTPDEFNEVINMLKNKPDGDKESLSPVWLAALGLGVTGAATWYALKG